MTVHDDLATLRLMYAHWTAKADEGVFCPDARDVDAALSRVEAEITRLRDETAESKSGLVTRLTQRAEAAEAEAARLRDGLRRIADYEDGMGTTYSPAVYARALLADQDGAARLPGENGWNYPPPTDAVNPGGAA